MHKILGDCWCSKAVCSGLGVIGVSSRVYFKWRLALQGHTMWRWDIFGTWPSGQYWGHWGIAKTAGIL